jgi:hypothetical protein
MAESEKSFGETLSGLRAAEQRATQLRSDVLSTLHRFVQEESGVVVRGVSDPLIGCRDWCRRMGFSCFIDRDGFEQSEVEPEPQEYLGVIQCTDIDGDPRCLGEGVLILRLPSGATSEADDSGVASARGFRVKDIVDIRPTEAQPLEQ